MSFAHQDRPVPVAESERRKPLDYSNFGVVRGLIRTRLYSTESVGVDVVRRVVAPGLVQRVVIDRGDAVLAVTYDLLRHWSIDEFQLFLLAERNVRAEGGVLLHRADFDLPLAAGLPPLTLLAGPEYLTAHARWLGDYPVTGPGGALLIMPSKQIMYAYPITGPEASTAVTVLAQLAIVSYADEAWPINPWVYWWRNGNLDLAATTRHDDEHLEVRPTGRFQRFVASLDGPPTRA
ncbi:hypothetical protein BJY24_003978 [Nocardia transvalensis]|uniref:Uncharacterized protein n=1 Tax=Nocardia transvalensis TaxID=37333 RepID=A0A7W9PFL8_9NOCA|nr:hypothetical protein [Nocardia transvalensis]MBB5915111.1 hypothetical protein [Nocardia transvalensis]